MTHLGLELENFKPDDIKISSSSPVYETKKDLEYMQRYQILMFSKELQLIQIIEVEFSWILPPRNKRFNQKNDSEPCQNMIKLIGMSCLVSHVQIENINFIRKFNEKGAICGTELMITNQDNGDWETDKKQVLALENFTETDYQFRNEICNSGYKKYFSKQIVKGGKQVDA